MPKEPKHPREPAAYYRWGVVGPWPMPSATSSLPSRPMELIESVRVVELDGRLLVATPGAVYAETIARRKA